MGMSGQNAIVEQKTRSLWRTVFMTLTGLAFIGFMAGGIATLHIRANAEAAPDPNPPVSVAVRPVRLTSGYTIIERFAGRLEPVRQTHLSFERAGLVTDVFFEEGDQVSQGAVVARLDTAKLNVERDRVQAQRKELEARQALAKVTLDRQRVLESKGWQSEQRYDEARFQLAEISASIGRLDAGIASIDVDIGKSVLMAPYAGTVASRLIDEGTVVNAGTAVIELLESGARQVRVGVSVEAAQSLDKGHIYRLGAGGSVFKGRLISKRPDLQTGTRTATVLLEALGGEDVPDLLALPVRDLVDVHLLELAKVVDDLPVDLGLEVVADGHAEAVGQHVGDAQHERDQHAALQLCTGDAGDDGERGDRPVHGPQHGIADVAVGRAAGDAGSDRFLGVLLA